MKGFTALLLLVLLVGAFAHKHRHEHNHKHEHHKHHEENEKQHQLEVCHFKSEEDGITYDLRLMNRSSQALSAFDKATHNIVYLRPCRAVGMDVCDPKAAVCVVEPSGLKAITFGTAETIQWAKLPATTEDNSASSHSIEATYANGEPCSDGIPRKTVVEYRCALQTSASPAATALTQESRIVSMELQPCFLSLVVESPYACPTAEYCHSITLEQDCKTNTQELCAWDNKGHCVAAEEKPCGHWRHVSAAQIMAIVTLLIFFFSVCCGLCCCACHAAKRKQQRCKAQSQQQEKMQEMDVLPEMEQTPEQPSAPQYRQIPIFYPGQQVPMSPYSMQGYPVLQFVIPPPQQKTEESA